MLILLIKKYCENENDLEKQKTIKKKKWKK